MSESHDSVFYEATNPQLLDEFNEAMGRITCLWEKLGIGKEKIQERSNSALQCVISCISDMEASEERLYKIIVDRIDDYTRQLQALTDSLGVPAIEIEDSIALIDRESILRSHLDDLKLMKHERLESLRDLRKIEKKYCLMLDMLPHEIVSKNEIPSEQDLCELEQHIEMLKDERERRYMKFCRVKRELSTIMEDTEIMPESAFERDVICYDDDQFLLSSQNLKELDTFVAKVQEKRAELIEEKEQLLEKLTTLWNRLYIDNEERQVFLSRHSDARISTIEEIKKEIDRCQELKMQNIATYIQLMKDELQELWKKCYISEEKQEHFHVVWNGELTETALEAYEGEVQEMRKYQKETEEICLKIEERQRLWNLMVEFENKASDPSRFNNRGGRLLQEERERRKVQKDLPRLENDLFVLIEKYEETSGAQFRFKGEKFQDHIRSQREQRLNEKEKEKASKQKQRTLAVEQGMTSKSTPSPKLKSNAGPSMLRTPNFHPRTRTPETTGKSKAQTPSQQNPQSLMPKGEENYSDESPNYSSFVKGLDKTSHTGFRSSVLPTRRVLGGKVACLRSRKSGLNRKPVYVRNTSKQPQN